MSASVDDTLSYLLVQVAKAHRSRMATGLEQLNLYVGQELVLLRLAEEDGTRQSALAARLGIELPTLSRALGRMERGGFVQRRADPEDARAVQVWLTEVGRAALAAIEQEWREVDEQLLKGLPEADRARLRRLLDALLHNITV